MTKRLIEDPLETEDDRLASAIDPFRKPRRVDAAQQLRALEPPMGEGLYIATCAECAFDFRSDDRYAVLCPLCDAREAEASQQQADQVPAIYHYSQFGRGRRD